MIYSDLIEAKNLLDIPLGDTSQDWKVNYFIETASRIIEEVINRPGLTYGLKTEYPNPSGTNQLCLVNRPVYTTTANPRVWVDDGGAFGDSTNAFASATELVYGTDFVLRRDQPDGSSRSGILIRLNNFWNKRPSRQVGYLSPFVADNPGTIKVQAYAGYTVDTLPADFRWAANVLIARMNYMMPQGQQIGGESYEERSVSFAGGDKDYLLGLVYPRLVAYRNHNW